MLRTILIAAAAAVAATAVMAQSDPIAARKALMKSVGGATGEMAKMAKGEAPFDLAKAKASVAVYVDVSGKFGALFPDTSKTGGETTADAKIWSDAAGFKAAVDKFGNEAKAANFTDEAGFKAAFGNLTKNCGSCHETYRVKK